MFITKAKICFRNIFMKMPNLEEDMRHAEFCKHYKPVITEKNLSPAEEYFKFIEEWCQDDYLRKRK